MDDTFPDLYALVLRLTTRTRGELPTSYGQLIQGLFMALIGDVDPDLGRALHAGQQPRSYTLAGLRPSARPFGGGMTLRAGERVTLRVTLLHGDLFGPVARTLMLQSTRPPLRLGSLELDLEEVIGTPGRDPLAGYTHWRQLAEDARPDPTIILHFATPTAFSQGEDSEPGTDRHIPRMGLLPMPETLFKSLAKRWNALAPADLQLDLAHVAVAAERAVVSRYELRTITHLLGRSTQVGFMGTCHYELRGDPDQRRLLNRLADAAYYTGVGIKTARGMGLCHRPIGEVER